MKKKHKERKLKKQKKKIKRKRKDERRKKKRRRKKKIKRNVKIKNPTTVTILVVAAAVQSRNQTATTYLKKEFRSLSQRLDWF